MTEFLPSLPGPPGPFATPRPAMRGRYLIRNPIKAGAMTLVDAALRLWPRRRHSERREPERILVADWGHLGDVVTTFGAIAALRRRYPGARVDMIVGSWGRSAIAATGLIDDFHVVDHWAINRSPASRAEKYRRYRSTRATALKAMIDARYDAAIDFYPFFPPAHPLFRRAAIPVTLGYESGGFSPLLSNPVQWSNASAPMAEQYRGLLEEFDPFFSDADLRPRRNRAGLSPLPLELAETIDFAVLHPGAGAGYKDWGIDRWRNLLAMLRERAPGMRLVLTGAGDAERSVTAELAGDHADVLDMAGKVDWEGFVSIVAHAALVICPDTATGHVAALFDTPVVSVFTGTNDAAQWAPYGEHARVVTHPVACAPCHRAGCDAMACVRSVDPEAVIAAASDWLP